MKKFNFKDVGEFSLIDEKNGVSVFLQLNESAKIVWEKFVHIWENPSLDIFQKKQEFTKIKSHFYDFVINVPVPYDKPNIVFDSEPLHGFYLSTLERPTKCYSYDIDDFSKNTGYQEVSSLNY